MCADADAIKIAEMIATNTNDSTKYTHPVSNAIEYYYNTPGVYQKRYKYLLNDICKQQTNTAFDPEYITLENLKFVVKHIMNNVDNDALLIRFKGRLPFGTGESINPTCESFATFVFNRK